MAFSSALGQTNTLNISRDRTATLTEPTAHQLGTDSLLGFDLSHLSIQLHVSCGSEASLDFLVSIFVNKDVLLWILQGVRNLPLEECF